MSYTVYRDQHCTVTHRVRGYRLRGGGGGAGAVKGLKEEKMVSSGSVQLEGPSQKTPHHKTRAKRKSAKIHLPLRPGPAHRHEALSRECSICVRRPHAVSFRTDHIVRLVPSPRSKKMCLNVQVTVGAK